MKFKLDECVDARLSIIFEQAEYRVATVYQQGLRGIEDERLYHFCMNEGYIHAAFLTLTDWDKR